jgi:hypothetical protein
MNSAIRWHAISFLVCLVSGAVTPLPSQVTGLDPDVT